MPSRKIISILIICVAAIFSVWLFTKGGGNKNQKIPAISEKNTEVVPAIQTKENQNDDWKKILTTVDKKSQFIDLTQKPDENDDTTLTDQMSRDFMSQYLLAIKSGQEITPQTAQIIAKNTISLSEYNQKAVVYIRQNLKITPKYDKATMQKYKEKINQSLQAVYYGLKDDPILIVTSAIGKESEAEMKKLDPIIAINKSTIKYLLEMEVPEKSVNVHLKLLNTSSAILTDLESMRVGLEDPVKIFGAMGNYAQDSANFAKVLTEMNDFLLKNT